MLVENETRRLTEFINSLPDATSACRLWTEKVIAWNRAIELLTGVPAQISWGKAILIMPFTLYGERRPDPWSILSGMRTMKVPCSTRSFTGTGEIRGRKFHRTPWRRNRHAHWAVAAPLYDTKGTVYRSRIESIPGHILPENRAEAILRKNEDLSQLNEELQASGRRAPAEISMNWRQRNTSCGTPKPISIRPSTLRRSEAGNMNLSTR
jgi:hypothetical protein